MGFVVGELLGLVLTSAMVDLESLSQTIAKIDKIIAELRAASPAGNSEPVHIVLAPTHRR